MNKIRIAVVSDIHAFNSANSYSDKSPSHLDISKPEDDPTNHPITGILKLIKDVPDLRADVLISVGDLCDKACPVSLKYAWGKIQEIKGALGAKEIISTTGNHDLDSRYQYNDFDAKGMMLSLSPIVPLEKRELSDQFWARNFAIFIFDKIRFLVVNTSAYHGSGKEDEIHHGRVSKQTIEAIKRELEGDEREYPVNILLCHHHPLRHDELDDDPSVMEGGDKLIDLIGRGLGGDWLVIHGHKHFPQIYNAAGGGSAPIIFSAGSLCANLYPALQTRARNQFHIIEIPVDGLESIGLGIVGSINSWYWAKGDGWKPSSFDSGIPHLSFFGFRGNNKIVAKTIIKIIDDSGDPFMKWSEIVVNKPEYQYIMPSDLLVVIEILKKQFYEVTWSSNGSSIEEIGKEQ